MREVEFTQFQGTKLVCKMMPGMKGHQVLFRLLDYVAAPVLATVARAFKSEGGKIDADIKVDELVQFATQVLFSKLDDEESARIIADVFDSVIVEGRKEGTTLKDHADEIFRGEVLGMWKVFAWAFEVNYRDFFSAVSSSQIPGWLAAAKAKTAASLLPTLNSRSGGSSEVPEG